MLVLPLFAQTGQPYYLKPDQTIDLAGANLVTAKENCANWGLAAGLESMLAKEKVALDQNFWVMRLNYGAACIEHLPSMDLVAKAVNQDFVLEDGRHVRLQLRFVPGPPTDIDTLLMGLKRNQLSLLLWRGHPYYLTGATYDEYIENNGARLFVIKELRLPDTFAKQPGTTFQRGRDKPEEIDGILSVSVTER